MKDSEFIELLNLYLDHEIGMADARRLEAEVQRSPERRRLYREYCQMQRACVLLAEQETEPLKENRPQVLAFEAPARSWIWQNYAVGACAAAAVFALAAVFYKGNGSAIAAPRTMDPAAVASVQISDGIAKLEGRRELAQTVTLAQRTPGSRSVAVDQTTVFGRQFRTPPASGLSNPRFDWMNKVELAALQRVNPDDLFFEPKSSAKPTDIRSFRGRRLLEGQAEQAAFQFQR
jgi:hypothetical protein